MAWAMTMMTMMTLIYDDQILLLDVGGMNNGIYEDMTFCMRDYG